MYNPKDIAKYFLSHYGEKGEITPMKLIKLVYIAHGWYLGITETPLIDQNPEAWKYGPVIPDLYHEYKYFGNKPITSYPSDFHIENPEIEDFLDKIWEVYGKFNGVELSAKTHQQGSPWSIVWDSIKNNPFVSLQIPENSIKEHYQGIIKKNNNS